MHLICVQLRGSVGREPRQSYKYAPHLSVSAFLLKDYGDDHYDTSPRIISLRFIPNKFPTLLAEREIIANASLLVRISPRTDGKDTK